MHFIRGRLSRLAVGWLAVQLAAFVVPVTTVTTHASVMSVSDSGCTCPESAVGHQCPMHQKRGTNRGDSNRCAMRSGIAQPDAVLLSLSVSGVMPAGRFLSYVPVAVEGVAPLRAVGTSRSELPEFPPPRA